MTQRLSTDTQAILMLTAPLIVGQSDVSVNPLTNREYRELTVLLARTNQRPADLLRKNEDELPSELTTHFDEERIQQLLARRFQLNQAVERWQSRAIWVVSHFDENYPARLKERLNDRCPAVIYGCGDPSILNRGGLAVVGSREVDDWLVEYTENVGRIAAEASRTLVSGGARGIDQASMRGALQAGGKAIGVMADSLDRAVVSREHRSLLIEQNLVLISPYDPAAGFNVGNAMQRNKLIYALADAALVVNTDLEKGGTWAGAVEQLDKFHFVPVYVRADGEIGAGLEALRRKGALPWPNPTTPEEFAGLVERSNQPTQAEQLSLL